MKTMVLAHKGRAFSQKGTEKTFVKDVLRVGSWYHPVTEQEIDITPKLLSEIVENTNRYVKNGNKIPFPDGHRGEALANLGYWPGPFTIQDGELFGVVEPLDAKAKQKVRDKSLDSVSVVIRPNVKDTERNEYSAVITQICATSYPIVTKQGPFMELSVDDTMQTVLLPGKGSKKLQASLDRLAELTTQISLDRLADQFLLSGHPKGKPGKTFAECVTIFQKERGVSAERARQMCGALTRDEKKLNTLDIALACRDLSKQIRQGG